MKKFQKTKEEKQLIKLAKKAYKKAVRQGEGNNKILKSVESTKLNSNP